MNSQETLKVQTDIEAIQIEIETIHEDRHASDVGMIDDDGDLTEFAKELIHELEDQASLPRTPFYENTGV